MRSPVVSEFSRRARLYAALDCRLAAQTRFFGAAAVTNLALAELFSRRAGRLWLSSNTFEFLLQVGRGQEDLNRTRALNIACGAIAAADLDRAMVSMEQTEVQAHLERVRASNSRVHSAIVVQLNRLLSLAGSPATPARLLRSAANYAHVLRAVSAELGHAASFAHQPDRECIGRTLIGRVRSLGIALP